jgi:hypothetical protein
LSLESLLPKPRLLSNRWGHLASEILIIKGSTHNVVLLLTENLESSTPNGSRSVPSNNVLFRHYCYFPFVPPVGRFCYSRLPSQSRRRSAGPFVPRAEAMKGFFRRYAALNLLERPCASRALDWVAHEDYRDRRKALRPTRRISTG